jgi:hypothetical protein
MGFALDLGLTAAKKIPNHPGGMFGTCGFQFARKHASSSFPFGSHRTPLKVDNFWNYTVIAPNVKLRRAEVVSQFEGVFPFPPLKEGD